MKVVQKSNILFFFIHTIFIERSAVPKMTENYSFDLPRFQYFSLPPNIIYHLWRYPLSTNGLQKLYQSCKYFFGKKRVPIVFHGYLWEDAIANYHQDFFGKVLNHIELPQNLMYWFDNSLLLYQFYNNIYRCTIKELDMRGGSITINDFKIITKENTIQKFYKFSSTISYPDGKVVPMDVVLKHLPNLTDLSYTNDHEPHSHEIFLRLNQLKFWNKFVFFQLCLQDIAPETFDPSLLCKFIRFNVKEKCSIYFHNSQNLSDLFSKTVNEMFNDRDANKPIVSFF